MCHNIKSLVGDFFWNRVAGENGVDVGTARDAGGCGGCVVERETVGVGGARSRRGKLGVGEDVEAGEVAGADGEFVGDGVDGVVGLGRVGDVAGGDGMGRLRMEPVVGRAGGCSKVQSMLGNGRRQRM